MSIEEELEVPSSCVARAATSVPLRVHVYIRKHAPLEALPQALF